MYLQSLQDDEVPSVLKTAFITPLLKKSNVNTDDLSNYWPVSNLPFLAKLLEQVAASWITSHVNFNHIVSSHQSAYRRFHSKETVLLRLLSDLTAVVGNLVLLALLDMSTAFDMVDHRILFERLDKTFWIHQDARKWISSYLSGHMQFVWLVCRYPQLNMEYHKDLFWGRFCLYCMWMSWKALYVAMGSHLTAMQMTASMFFFCRPDEQDKLKVAVMSCISNVSDWMSSNTLKLNPTKTEFLWVAMSRRRHLIDHCAITVSGADIKPSTCVKLPGVLRWWPVNLSGIHFYLLQSVLNAAARLSFGPHVLSTSLNFSDTVFTGWAAQNAYNLNCVSIYNAVNGMAPDYIKELFLSATITERHATLWSAVFNTSILTLPTRSTNIKFGYRAFWSAGPTTWNSLPINKIIQETSKYYLSSLFHRGKMCVRCPWDVVFILRCCINYPIHHHHHSLYVDNVC